MRPSSGHQAFLLTPSGAGAIAVIRVVGPDAPMVVSEIFRGKGTTRLTGAFADQLLYGLVVDGEEVIDDVLVSRAAPMVVGETESAFPAVDISCHGGVRVVERILKTLESRGVVVGKDKETTQVAWAAHTLIEREAIDAIAKAKTERAVRFAARLRTQLVPRLRELADLITGDPTAVRSELRTLMAGYSAARVLLDGATVALVGPPNSGKSTLFNRLVGRTAAVTSPIPGTTRDWIAEWVEIDGVPVNLIDTAGRREAVDTFEREAVEYGELRARSADVTLVVLDGSRDFGDAGRGVLLATSTAQSRLVVANKSDLGLIWAEADLRMTQPSCSSELVCASAITGAGMDELCRMVFRMLGLAAFDGMRAYFFTERQVQDAEAALGAVTAREAAEVIRRRLIGA